MRQSAHGFETDTDDIGNLHRLEICTARHHCTNPCIHARRSAIHRHAKHVQSHVPHVQGPQGAKELIRRGTLGRYSLGEIYVSFSQQPASPDQLAIIVIIEGPNAHVDVHIGCKSREAGMHSGYPDEYAKLHAVQADDTREQLLDE